MLDIEIDGKQIQVPPGSTVMDAAHAWNSTAMDDVGMELFRRKYERLPTAERETLLRSLAQTHPQFRFSRFERFERFGIATETAVYLCDESEFVFVPGDEVTLGWESFADGMDKMTRAELTAEYEIPDVDGFLKEQMSPVRQVRIAPMLAERVVNPIGWHSVPFESTELDPFRADIEKHFHASNQCYEICGKMRVSRKDGGIAAEIYTPVALADFFAQIHADGFSLPTEDEWEYLCGGGKRTLFRWGDSFDYAMKLRHFNVGNPHDDPFTLELPNGLGIVIAHDPYQQEVLENSSHFLKGGDGGCSLCGGAGMTLGYLPVATFFRPECLSDDYQDDIGGDYTFFRRIVRPEAAIC